jgi:hypothetical protein
VIACRPSPEASRDHGLSPERIALAAHPLAARGAGRALPDRALRARRHAPRAARAGAGTPAREVAGDPRRRAGARRIGRDRRVPGRAARRRAPRAAARDGGPRPVSPVAPLRRGLGDAAAPLRSLHGDGADPGRQGRPARRLREAGAGAPARLGRRGARREIVPARRVHGRATSPRIRASPRTSRACGRGPRTPGRRRRRRPLA